MANNEQINNTSYYQLPCGKYLEDFIHVCKLNFAEGSALKYLWRAGNKDGESKDKDMDKYHHYFMYILHHSDYDTNTLAKKMGDLFDSAKEWDGTSTKPLLDKYYSVYHSDESDDFYYELNTDEVRDNYKELYNSQRDQINDIYAACQKFYETEAKIKEMTREEYESFVENENNN